MLLRNTIGPGHGIRIEVALLIREIPGQQVAHAWIYMQITPAPQGIKCSAVSIDSGYWRERVLLAMNDGGRRCPRTDVTCGGQIGRGGTTLQQLRKPTITHEVEGR